jgi:RNA polymerase sigma-B factor
MRSESSANRASEQWLLRRYHRDRDSAAREELVRRMAPLVRRIATTYSAPGHEDDLRQAAYLGLAKAIERYDASFGVSLRTYAIPTMYGEVRRYLRDHSWAVRVPRPLQERAMSVTKAARELTTRNGRAPTVQLIADEMDISPEQVSEALQAGRAHTATSLDALAGDDESERTVAEVFGHDDERLDRVDNLVRLRSLRGLLDEREREVMRLRFVKDKTQMQIGQQIGCSQMQVSRILRAALARLSDAAESAEQNDE